MKIFVDTANINEIRAANSYGILDGVTTNPSLIKKAVAALAAEATKVTMHDSIKTICETVGENCPVSLEVVGLTYQQMLDEGHFLYETFNPVANNVVIKIPANPSTEAGADTASDGLRCIRVLASEGIPVNTTLVMTPLQALLAAKAGAAFVSPFIGRIDDYLRTNAGVSFSKSDYFPANGLTPARATEALHDNGVVSGIDLLRRIVAIFRTYSVATEVLAASVRNARQARECAEVGAHIATIPFAVLNDLLDHPKTVEGIHVFSRDTIPEYRDLLRARPADARPTRPGG